jgi:hypothetical protein
LMIFYSMWIIQSAVGSKDAILSYEGIANRPRHC